MLNADKRLIQRKNHQVSARIPHQSQNSVPKSRVLRQLPPGGSLTPYGRFYLFSIATATSRATFIMVVKEFWRSSAEVSTPVSTWSEMVQMHRPRLP